MDQAVVKEALCAVGTLVCDKIHATLRCQSIEEKSAVHLETEADTIYRIDFFVEEYLVSLLRERAEALGGIVLIAEGVSDAGRPLVLPDGMREDEAAIRLLVDPIDGTRGVMYDKRSAFFLAGAAPNQGAATSLRDIETAAMVEIPTTRSHLSDMLWALRGQGARAVTRDMFTNRLSPRPIVPSQSKTLLGGFAQISRFFPPGKDLLARVEEEMIAELYPDPPAGRAILFEDQYISTGGQMYELLMGHDRFNADLRTGLYKRLGKEGATAGLHCHPYDLSACLIAEEGGVIVTGRNGGPVDAPLDTTSPVDWIAYANPYLRAEVEPVLQRLLKKYGLV
ncbi:MAG: hypothetical protein AB1656_19395 [Candidatus Omnitrophota bacterium]